MIVRNRAQLKAWIKNMSAKIDANENIILQNYMLERLLERISVSDYKYKLYDIFNAKESYEIFYYMYNKKALGNLELFIA